MDDISLRSRAISLLARREHSRAELLRKLTQRGGQQEVLEAVLDELEAEGLLSEARFVEAFVHSRTQRGQGPVKIRAELSRRGVDDDLMERFLTRTSDSWLQLARSARVRRFGEDSPDDKQAWARQARFLSSRGFPADLIYSALSPPRD